MMTHSPLAARVVAGARLGLRTAVFFTALALVGWAVAGAAAFERRLGVGPTTLVVVYLFGAITGGGVFALLRPRVRDTWGAALVGAATIVPAAAALAVAQAGRSSWSARGVFATLALSFAVGSAWGAMFWRSRGRHSRHAGSAHLDSTTPAS